MKFVKELDKELSQIATANTVERAKALMRSRPGLWLVGLVSFFESAAPVPLITDPFMVAAMLLNRKKIALIVFITAVTSVLGGVAAYFTAVFFLDVMVKLLSPDMQATLANLTDQEASGTIVLTLVGAITPIPYTLTAYAVALIKGNLFLFITLSFFGRAFRYGILGVLVYYFGPAAVSYARRSFAFTTIVLLVLLTTIFWLKM